jgi:predicted lipoprotein with Yx(FWY)xxD motif
MPTVIHRPLRYRLVACAAAGASALGVAALPILSLSQAQAGAASPPVLQSANIPNYAGILENSATRSLYVLSTGKGAKLHCTTSACLKSWHPLVVKSSTKSISVSGAVKGKIGFVKRSATTKQVTFNTYPVYTFAGDSGVHQSHGEAVVAFGGTWLMLHASAKSTAATPVAPLLQSANIPGWPGVLENDASRSLYVLSVESGGTIKCTGKCATTWLPVLVTPSTTSIAVGAGVKGTIGFVARGSSAKQVTFNKYPVYTYTGDSGPNQSNGEDIPADGGTWTLVHASATSNGGTPDAIAPAGRGGWVRPAR